MSTVGPGPRPSDPQGPITPDAGVVPGYDSGAITPGDPMMPPVDPAAFGSLADGVSIASVSAFQTVEIPLMGAAPTNQTPPLIASKELALRVGVTVTAGFSPQPLKAIVTIGGQTFEAAKVIAATSNPGDPSSYFMVVVPPTAVTAAMSVQVQILAQAGSPMGTPGHGAVWPLTGVPHPLQVVVGAPLDIVLVPVINRRDAADGSITITPERLELYRQMFIATLPIDPNRFTISTHAPHTTNQTIDNAGDVSYHSRVLDEILELHRRDGANPRTVYYGLLSFNYDTFPCDGCPGGIALPGDAYDGYVPGPGEQPIGPCAVGDHFHSWSTNSTVLQTLMAELQMSEAEVRAEFRSVFEDDPNVADVDFEYAYWLDAIEDEGGHSIALHEVLHTLSFAHVTSDRDSEPPAGPNPQFPYANGGLGRDGYDSRHDIVLPRASFRDVMSYTSTTTWTSDYHYALVYNVLNGGGPAPQALTARLPTSHLRVLVATDGALIRSGTVMARQNRTPATDDDTDVVLVYPRALDGRPMEPVAAQLKPHSDTHSAHLFIPEVDGAGTYELRQPGLRVSFNAPSAQR